MMRCFAVALLVSVGLPALAAERVKVFVFAEPDPALGGLVSAAVLDSVDDLKTLIGRRVLGYGGMSTTDKRTEATLLVQVLSRKVVDDEYRVMVRATFNGETRELTGTDVRQWKRCVVPIAAALRDWTKAEQATR